MTLPAKVLTAGAVSLVLGCGLCGGAFVPLRAHPMLEDFFVWGGILFLALGAILLFVGVCWLIIAAIIRSSR